MRPRFDVHSGFCAFLDGGLRLMAFIGLLLVFFPFLVLFACVGRRRIFRTSHLFYRGLVHVLGINLRVHGARLPGGSVLFVSNHTSYLDIPVLGACIEGVFVAKAEVASWPFFGPLAKLQRTAFIERRVLRAAEQRDDLRQRLLEGQNLILFPEGTSSDGQRTLPFKSSLFSLAEIDVAEGRSVIVQPVTTLCTGLGGLPFDRSWRSYYAWYGDMTLMGHLWNAFKMGRFTVDVIFHDPVSINDFSGRKELAAHCHKVIAEGVERCVTGRFSGVGGQGLGVGE
jgi:lyso-ornithine lipid O-acyltransferase